MSEQPLTDRERFPLINPAGLETLNRLRQHGAAPRFNYHCGEKLSESGLKKVQDLAGLIRKKTNRWNASECPAWLPEFVKHCYRDVPFYRSRDQGLDFEVELDLAAIPLIDRSDLRKQPWMFVPDSADLDELIVYSTSGTTGNFLKVICNPDAPASYLPLMESALAQHGITIDGGSRVSIMHVAAQKSTYTHCSVMSYFDFAGFVKVNLHPDQWSSPDDRITFIDDCNAEIYTGDPFAFVELAKLDLKTKPKAIISSATQLLPAVQAQLESHFGCPVIDMISTNETGPLGFGGQGRHQVFAHHLFVEIVDAAGNPVPPGQRGEIVVSGGVNSMMPLLRYRTGDYAALEFEADQPVLVDFAGRTPVDFVGPNGQLVRSIDVVVKLFRIPLPVFRLHQHADERLVFETRCDPFVAEGVLAHLKELFGSCSDIEIKQLADQDVWQGKAIQFSNDMNQKTTEMHVLD